MNFIRYNPQTGDIIVYGFMEAIYVQQEIDAGQPTMFTEEVCDFKFLKVDLTTMTVVPKTPEEIAQSQQNLAESLPIRPELFAPPIPL